MKDRTLILIRHADRDTSEGRGRDNGLSAKGSEQARAIARHFGDRFAGAEPMLLSSPKVRCIETLLPLSDRLGIQVKVLDLLDEQDETEKAFLKRVETFHRWWRQKAPEVTVACSHGDWIPLFTRLVLGTGVDLKKGAWLEIELREGVPRLRGPLQKLPKVP